MENTKRFYKFQINENKDSHYDYENGGLKPVLQRQIGDLGRLIRNHKGF